MRRDILGRPTAVAHAVDDVSFTIARGETLGLVGESGCGKSTLARCLVRLIEPTGGTVTLGGRDITHLRGRAMRQVRQDMQIVFQDPFSSLNPRLTAGVAVGEPLRNFGIARGRQLSERVAELFRAVGLRPDQMKKLPHEFSGGQRQRLGIARAIALEPALVVCDEPVSALDVSVQAQVINLLADLQKRLDLAYFFVAHDLAVVRHVSNRIAVMYLGQIVEMAPARSLFAAPRHPYTEALLEAVPIPDPTAPRDKRKLSGDVPSATDPAPGCRFHTRCPYRQPLCLTDRPPLRELAPGHFAACHFSEEIFSAAAPVATETPALAPRAARSS